LQGIVFHKAALPQLKENVCLRPLLEAAMGGTTGTDTRLVQRIPLASRAQHEENGLHRLPIIDPWPVAPERVRLPWREQGVEALPQGVGYPPIPLSFLLGVTHG
jgi:hypothetical protein